MTKNELKKLINECVTELSIPNVNDSDLDEVLKDEEIEFEKKHAQVINYDFDVDGNKYEFIANLYNIGDKSVLSVWFKLKNGKNDGMGIEGHKKSFIVFQKVVNILKSIVKKESPYYITFEARESSRQDLYKKIISYIDKRDNFPYEFEKNNPITGDENDASEFWLKRK